MYIQFKIFKTIEELNTWLKQFQRTKMGDQWVMHADNVDGQRVQLLDVTWLPCGNVAGDGTEVSGSIGHYAVAKYGVWGDVYN